VKAHPVGNLGLIAKGAARPCARTLRVLDGRGWSRHVRVGPGALPLPFGSMFGPVFESPRIRLFGFAAVRQQHF